MYYLSINIKNFAHGNLSSKLRQSITSLNTFNHPNIMYKYAAPVSLIFMQVHVLLKYNWPVQTDCSVISPYMGKLSTNWYLTLSTVLVQRLSMNEQ